MSNVCDTRLHALLSAVGPVEGVEDTDEASRTKNSVGRSKVERRDEVVGLARNAVATAAASVMTTASTMTTAMRAVVAVEGGRGDSKVGDQEGRLVKHMTQAWRIPLVRRRSQALVLACSPRHSSVGLGGTEQRKVADWCEGERMDGRKHPERWSIRLWKTGEGESTPVHAELHAGSCVDKSKSDGKCQRIGRRRAEAAEAYQAESAWVQPAPGYSQALWNPVKPAPGSQIWIVRLGRNCTANNDRLMSVAGRDGRTDLIHTIIWRGFHLRLGTPRGLGVPGALEINSLGVPGALEINSLGTPRRCSKPLQPRACGSCAAPRSLPVRQSVVVVQPWWCGNVAVAAVVQQQSSSSPAIAYESRDLLLSNRAIEAGEFL
ncbi:hypothetical protein C8F01DRAFT_1224586 [Mycena amicta]|nr:hypothetical protein C8F01DRAFT_1224586 [Mycena amicta]